MGRGDEERCENVWDWWGVGGVSFPWFFVTFYSVMDWMLVDLHFVVCITYSSVRN